MGINTRHFIVNQFFWGLIKLVCHDICIMTNVINGDPRKISELEFQMLRAVLIDVIQMEHYGEIRDYITDIERSVRGVRGYNVHITNRVHVSEYDPNGMYHFNIRLSYGRLDTNGQVLHVYVNPLPVCSEQNQGVSQHPDGSVTLDINPCRCYWRWVFQNITT
jgi:hypothetical protein